MAAFYTRGGDKGDTGLLGRERVAKYSLRIETIGTLDEANAALGVVRSHSNSPEVQGLILATQKKLYELMAEIAATPENKDKFKNIGGEAVIWLETQIETYSAKVEIPRQFIIPGDSQCGAYLSLARTIVRRAERRVAKLIANKELSNPFLLVFLNRLSSLLFVLELFENKEKNINQQTLVK